MKLNLIDFTALTLASIQSRAPKLRELVLRGSVKGKRSVATITVQYSSKLRWLDVSELRAGEVKCEKGDNSDQLRIIGRRKEEIKWM